MKRNFGWLAAIALVAVTTVAFAGRPKFAATNIYIDVAGSRSLIVNTSSMPGLTLTGSNQARIVSSLTGTNINLVTHDGTNFVPLYTNGY